MRVGRGVAALLAGGLALAIGACAAGGGLELPAAAKRTVPEAVAVADGPVLAAADGELLPLSSWEAEAPQAAILALHGFGDYGPSTFGAAAADWAARGITTYAYDQRGFGRGRTRGLWPGEGALIADAVLASVEVRRRHPCLPLVVVGHSMGGGVVLAAAANGLEADALVLAAPAIWGGRQLNPLHRAAAWLAAVAMPDRRFTGRGVVRIQASDNIEVLRQLGRDPFYLGRPSARELMGLVRVTDAAAAAAPSVDRPALLLLGARDEILPEARVRAVFDRLPGARGTIRYDDGWHLLFRDLQAARVWQDVADWALAQQPPAACGVEAGAGASAG